VTTRPEEGAERNHQEQRTHGSILQLGHVQSITAASINCKTWLLHDPEPPHRLEAGQRRFGGWRVGADPQRASAE
jgi:hypothetical protein